MKIFNDISFSIKKKCQKHFKGTQEQIDKLGRLYWNIFSYNRDE